MVRELDIRKSLHAKLEAQYKDDHDTLIIDELGVCQGAARVDIALVNGQLHGFEIKSEQDTLERLPRQAALYSRVFDSVTLVASEEHALAAESELPPWWGITLAISESDSPVALIPYRRADMNPYVDARAVVELLWRDEALQLLERRGAAKGYRSKPRGIIWNRVCEVYTLDEIKVAVRQILKRRKGQQSARS